MGPIANAAAATTTSAAAAAASASAASAAAAAVAATAAAAVLLQHLQYRRESLSLGFGEVRIILKGDKSIVRQFVQQRGNCSETSQLIRVRYHAKNLPPPA